MTNYHKILSQGIFDGYCLLYAIMNSYKALSEANDDGVYDFVQYPRVAKKWRKLIALSPSLENFSSGKGSEFDYRATRNLIDSYVHAVCDKMNKFCVEPIPQNKVRETDFSESVLIFAIRTAAKTKYYTDLDHWVCGVDIQNNSVLLACSYALHKRGLSYKEYPVPNKNGRYFNNKIPVIETESGNIYKQSIYSIKKIHKKS